MAVRVTVVRFFKPSLYPVGPYVAAYLSWIVLFAMGMGLAAAAGFRLHAVAPIVSRQKLGDLIAFFSPFGLPLLAGAPLVLVLDLAMSISRWFAGGVRRRA